MEQQTIILIAAAVFFAIVLTTVALLMSKAKAKAKAKAQAQARAKAKTEREQGENNAATPKTFNFKKFPGYPERSKTKQFELDKLKISPNVLPLLITTENVNNYIPKASSLHMDLGVEPSMIDEYLPVNLDATKLNTPTVSGRATFAKMTSNQRGRYLRFLEDPYTDTDDSPGYLIVLFYGLERHLLHGDNAKAMELIEDLRRHHAKISDFIKFSFNALAFYAKTTGSFMDFLKYEYDNLNVGFTLYYHMNTDRVLPSEAIVRFIEHFGGTKENHSINPIILKAELDAFLELTYNSTSFPLKKYESAGKVLTEKMPFPANPSMDKVVNKYVNAKPFYETDPFYADISSIVKRALLSVRTKYKA